jgi:hypothetical protein
VEVGVAEHCSVVNPANEATGRLRQVGRPRKGGVVSSIPCYRPKSAALGVVGHPSQGSFVKVNPYDDLAFCEALSHSSTDPGVLPVSPDSPAMV